MIIREIEQKDNVEIATLIREVLTEFGVNRPGTVFTDPTTDHLFELFSRNESAYFIAESDGKIVGGCGLFPTIGLPELDVSGRLPLLYIVALFAGLAAIGLGLLLGMVAKTQEQSAPCVATFVVI